MKPLRFSLGMMVCAIMAASMSGCGKKLSEEQKSLLSLAAINGKESGSGFELIRISLAPRKGVDTVAFARWIASHGAGLNSQASAIKYFVDAVTSGSALSSNAREQLIAAADTADARAGEFEYWTTRIDPSENVAVWLGDHQATLNAQADAIRKLAALLTQDEEKK